MAFDHTCRKCKYLELTRKHSDKEWTCNKKNKNKSFEQIIFDNLCAEFDRKDSL